MDHTNPAALPDDGVAGDDDLLTFAEEEPPGEDTAGTQRWKVLAIDDDPDFQRSMAFSLRSFSSREGGIELLQAYNTSEAAAILARERDIAVLLLDVVMESDDAGLRLVRAIRETMGNAEVRIVLVTGAPGVAPMKSVMADFDINDYWTKSELSVERLHTLLVANIRAYQYLTSVSRARRGLQMIVESSNALIATHSLGEFSSRILREIAKLIGVPPEGMICVEQRGEYETTPQVQIISAAGRFSPAIDHYLEELGSPPIEAAIRRCLAEQQHLSLPDCRVLFFPGTQDSANYAAYLSTPQVLDATEEELLRVFTVNIRSGLHNVALVSRLDEMAFQDPLLGIANRNALVRGLEDLYGLRCKNGEPCLGGCYTPGYVLFMLDIDEFSTVNLTLGFEQGNRQLREVSRRLRAGLSPTLLVARLHDDIFAILGPGSEVTEARINELLGLTGGDGPPQFVSIGSARLDLAQFRGTPTDAIVVASLLLKTAKRRGLSQHEDYRPGLESATAERYRLAMALRDALGRGEIHIALQPQVELASGRLTGAEALARWTLPSGETVPPGIFIPLAEATGLIVTLGEQVLRQACRAVVQLVGAGLTNLRVAVNVSTLQFAREGLLQDFLRILREEGVTPRQIEIEITESLAMQDIGTVQQRLQAFRDQGFEIAIDDFGTGFSSLSYLRRLPIDRLKIDQAFVAEIGTVDDENAIAEMVIRIAQRMGMTVIAEGVETPTQAAWLQARGCQDGQGYHFARPLALEDLLQWQATRNPG